MGVAIGRYCASADRAADKAVFAVLPETGGSFQEFPADALAPPSIGAFLVQIVAARQDIASSEFLDCSRIRSGESGAVNDFELYSWPAGSVSRVDRVVYDFLVCKVFENFIW